jgi:CBS domain-containing membrane protein
MTLVKEHHDSDAEHSGFQHVGILLTHMRMEWLLRHFPPRLVWAVYVCVNGFITIGLLGLLALLTGSPFVFPSLGPTAYLFFFSPLSESSSPRNTILGHAIGLVCGYGAYALAVASSPPFGVKGGVKAGQCAGVKVGHFYMGRFLEVAGSVASEA